MTSARDSELWKTLTKAKIWIGASFPSSYWSISSSKIVSGAVASETLKRLGVIAVEPGLCNWADVVSEVTRWECSKAWRPPRRKNIISRPAPSSASSTVVGLVSTSPPQPIKKLNAWTGFFFARKLDINIYLCRNVYLHPVFIGKVQHIFFLFIIFYKLTNLSFLPSRAIRGIAKRGRQEAQGSSDRTARTNILLQLWRRRPQRRGKEVVVLKIV